MSSFELPLQEYEHPVLVRAGHVQPPVTIHIPHDDLIADA
jgi:hypothetical protein